MRTIRLCWLILLACTSVLVDGNFTFPSSNLNSNEWWRNTVIYQVYPRSFKDSNKDGIGDLNGITEKLDHFLDIGVDTVWIGPIFKSPMFDMGYDVEDFKMIDPIFGTMDDFMRLVKEMNKRDLKLITDIIPNHSSDKSEWFQKSVRREGKYTDYYMWKDAKNHEEVKKNSSITRIPPNNWLSVFGGTGWTWHPERKQFYFHQFNPKQPDFNMWNPEIHKEIFDIMQFWLDKGIIGFRFDAIKHLYESNTYLDEEFKIGKENSTEFEDMIHKYIVDQPENIDIIYNWREYVDNYTINNNLSIPRIVCTESYSTIDELMKYYGNETNHGSHIPFNFGLLRADKNYIVESINENIQTWLGHLSNNHVANWVVENHDNNRIPDQFGPEMVPVLIVLQLLLPGIAVTYYGGEIGMHDAYVRPDQTQDPNNKGGTRTSETRDPSRCPMQWDNSTNAGFTDAIKPWLPINPNYYELNVEAQKQIPSSIYNFYRKMVQLRKTDTLKYGDLHVYNISTSIFIVKRSLAEHESYIAVMNFGSEYETVGLAGIIDNIKNKLYIYLGSKNSLYTHGDSVPTNDDGNYLLKLRPQSVVLLTDKIVTVEPPKSNSGISNAVIGFSLINLMCALLYTSINFYL